MTLQETKEAFLRWVESCDKVEQVDLLAEIMGEFIVLRYGGIKGMELDVEMAANEIISVMADRKLIIKRLYFQSLPKES